VYANESVIIQSQGFLSLLNSRFYYSLLCSQFIQSLINCLLVHNTIWYNSIYNSRSLWIRYFSYYYITCGLSTLAENPLTHVYEVPQSIPARKFGTSDHVIPTSSQKKGCLEVLEAKQSHFESVCNFGKFSG